jgi:hypothetical protein
MENRSKLEVICMTAANDSRDVYVVETDESRTPDVVIARLIEGEKDMSPYKSGFVVGEEWSRKILREYNRYDGYSDGHWEYPGIYVTSGSNHFTKNAYLPYYIEAKWIGDSSDISE